MYQANRDMEDDRDELLEYSEEEDSPSISETDEPSLIVDNQEALIPSSHTYDHQTNLEFFLVKFSLLLSTFFLIILLPIYIETVNVKSDVYTMLFCVSTFTVSITLVLLILLKYLCPAYKSIKLLKYSIGWLKVFRLAIVYTVSGFMVVYAMDRKRVVCHIQDPIKGAVLVFSLLYYFFFCRKQMGLQRIFSTTTIIVGLFISVDYGLCDEFTCRGYSREHVADDGGQWSWKVHTVWTVVYISGLALFAAFFTLLDRDLLLTSTIQNGSSMSSCLLSTVSRSIAHPDTVISSVDTNNARNAFVNSTPIRKTPSALQLAFYIHLFGWFITASLYWTDIIDFIGKAPDAHSFINTTMKGILCHFYPADFTKDVTNECANLSLYSWLFTIVYVVFAVSSIRFTILSQSAVYTVATMASSLPLVCIWWSVFRMIPVSKGMVSGMIEWNPSVSGELICALLGLPVVLLGLYLLCKSYFQDSRITLQKNGHSLANQSSA